MRFWHWLRLWRVRRASARMLDASEEELFRNVSIILPSPGQPREMGEITGVFHTVGKEIQQATQVAQQARAAAERITEAIGAPPVLAKKS